MVFAELFSTASETALFATDNSMQQVVDLILQFGRFSMTVVAVCVVAMLIISLIDGLASTRHPPEDPDHMD